MMILIIRSTFSVRNTLCSELMRKCIWPTWNFSIEHLETIEHLHINYVRLNLFLVDHMQKPNRTELNLMKGKHQVRCHSSNGVIKFLFMFPIFKYLRLNQLVMVSLNSTCVHNTETWIQCYKVQLTTNDFMDAFITRILLSVSQLMIQWWQFSLSHNEIAILSQKIIFVQSVPFRRAQNTLPWIKSRWHQAKPK